MVRAEVGHMGQNAEEARIRPAVSYRILVSMENHYPSILNIHSSLIPDISSEHILSCIGFINFVHVNY